MASTPDMTPPNGFDGVAQWSRLSERVENQGKDIIDMRSNMNSGFQAVNASISALSNELRGNSRTPWGTIWSAIGVSFAIILALGSGQLSPVKDDIADLKGSMRDIVSVMITQKEMDWRTKRGEEDRARTEKAIADLRLDQVPRKEHERVWQNYDNELANSKADIARLTTQYSDTYNPRDVIIDLRERLDRVERARTPQQ